MRVKSTIKQFYGDKWRFTGDEFDMTDADADDALALRTVTRVKPVAALEQAPRAVLHTADLTAASAGEPEPEPAADSAPTVAKRGYKRRDLVAEK